MYELLFDDEQAILSYCKAEIQNHTDQLNRSCINHSMRISVSKSKVMTVGSSPRKLDISIDGTHLKHTAELKYFRQPFCSKWESGQRDRDMLSESKCSQLYHLAPLLQHPNIPMDTKAKLITLTYQCQTWALIKSWREN